MRPNRLIISIAALLLATASPVPLSGTSEATAQAVQARTTILPTNEGQVGPPRIINPAQLPAAKAATTPSLKPRLLPFLPRDPTAFQRAKAAANAGNVPSRHGLKMDALPLARPHARGVETSQSGQVLAGFPVMSYEQQVSSLGSDQQTWPPDTQLAAGLNYLLEMVNDSGSIWTKSGSLAQTFDLNTFFRVPPGYSFFDPRVLYDSLSGRWFASGGAVDSYTNDSQVYVAVSATSDPTGNWYFYTVESNTSGILYDQPKIGVSSDKVVISWNDYGGGGASFTGQETWVLQKSDLLAGGAYYYWYFGPDPSRFDIVPVQSLTATSTEYLVYNNSDPNLNQNLSYPSLGVVAITGTPAQGNVAWNERDPSILPTLAPPAALQPNGPLIATDDDRLLSAVWQNGVIWTAGNDGCLPPGDSLYRSCERLIEVSTASSPTVMSDGDVYLTGGYLYYPAVTLDGNGDLFVSVSESSATVYPSAVAVGATTDGSRGVASYLGVGQGPYNCGACTGGFNGDRWGDYSAAAPDPSNPLAIWAAGEYSASSADTYDWGTGAAELTLYPAPALTPTSTPIQSPTPTPAGTATPSPTNTPTPPPTPTPTDTATTTPTSTPTPLRVFLPDVFNDATNGPS